MAELTIVPITKAGTDITSDLVAADVAGDEVDATDNLIVVIDNQDVGPLVVTIAAVVPETNCSGYGGLPVADLVYNVAAGEMVAFAVPRGYWVDSKILWAYDVVANVFAGVFTSNAEA